MMPQFNPYMPYPMAPGMQAQMQAQMPTQPVMPTQMPPYPQFTQVQQGQEFDWIRVNTLEDVKNVSVAPGKKAWIMLQNDPVFVVKSANDMGLATTQAFKFEPYDPQQQAAQAPAAEYAPLSVVQQLQARIDELTAELNAMKGGVTRGKPVKQSAGTAAE